MKIDVVTPSVSYSSGGVGSAVVNLYNNLTRRYKELEITIKTLAFQGQHIAECNEHTSINYREFSGLFVKRFGFSQNLLINAITSKSDLIHAHGLWMPTTYYNNLSHAFFKKPYIISPHGMLDPWILKHGKLKKRVAKSFYEGYSWRNCSVFHALNSHEADGILKLLPNAKIEIIPNGIQVLEENNPNLKFKTDNDIIRILFLSRFHEKKNLHGLVNAVNNISKKEYDKSPFKIIIAGWGDEQYKKKIQSLIHEKYPNRFEFLGAVYGDSKKALFKSCDCFILPSFSEGLPVAILEAWSYGLPALITDECNLKESFSKSASIRLKTDPADIARIILYFTSLNADERLILSSNAYTYAKSIYNWDVVCCQFNELYSNLIN